MKKQKVIRTRPTGKQYSHEPSAYQYLDDALNEGYEVIMCTPIGADLEYILEKDEQADKPREYGPYSGEYC